MSIPSARIAVPQPPEAPAPYRFPVIASTAPVLIAVAIWAITGSVFALIFAALGPVTALASFVDSRIGGRRTNRRQLARFDREMATATELIAVAHAHESTAIAEWSPDAAEIVARRGADPYRWSRDPDTELLISLGIGSRASAVDLYGPSVAHPHSDLNAAVKGLVALASRVNAPVLAEARLGIALCGPTALTASWARAIAVQLAWALAPDRFWYRALPTSENVWLDALPHVHEPGDPGHGALLEFGSRGDVAPLVRVVASSDPAQLPGGCRVIIAIRDDGEPHILEHPDRSARQPVTISALSREDAFSWAHRVRAEAVRDGRIVAMSGIPDRVDLTDVLARARTGAGLTAPVGLGVSGDIELDLVTHGPHAVVGGTTGSGKSELLIAWVLSMAAMHSPSVVNFLLVDFKGGAAFASLESLPHTVGTITDLDEDTARRALDSLRAELRFRERELSLAGARSIEEHDELARLVIVVDEFQAMLADYPELHSLFSDIAARGRSLGVHLILCTQRPGGVVRDAVLANADLRISLRVNNRSDSAAVVGTDDAARIAVSARGRAVIRVGGEAAIPVQFALADAAVHDRVAQAWPGHADPRRPWCEPLSARILLRDLPTHSEGVTLGMLDLPHEQRWDVATWNPASGHLLVVGAPRSGKTAALATITAGVPEAVVLPAEPHLAWRLLSSLAERPEALTLVLDDLDSLLSRFSADYRAEFVERVGLLLREGPAWGMSCAVSVARLGGELSTMSALFVNRLMLAQPSRNEHVLAGGEGSQFREGLPAGGGIWRGDRIQVALAGHPLVPARLAPDPPIDGGPLAIVTGRPAQVTRAMAADPGNEIIALDRDVATALGQARGRAIVIADVDQWQAHWGTLSAVRSSATVVIHACTPADFRTLTRSRELPPLLAPRDVEACWVLDDEGSVRRARLPLTSSGREKRHGG